jgi:hypothetical protein
MPGAKEILPLPIMDKRAVGSAALVCLRLWFASSMVYHTQSKSSFKGYVA